MKRLPEFVDREHH